MIRNPGDFTSPPTTIIDPSPVFAELQPAGAAAEGTQADAAEEAEAGQAAAAPARAAPASRAAAPRAELPLRNSVSFRIVGAVATCLDCVSQRRAGSARVETQQARVNERIR